MNVRMQGQLKGVMKEVARGALDLFFPPLCISCREQVSEPGSLCATCWSAIQFLDGPACATCGLPFELETIGETLCAACHAAPPAFDKARAVMRYDDASKGPILAFKHGDRLDLVPGFARWLERGGRDVLSEASVIVPVPLHPTRLWSRRYNQSAELGRAIARLIDKPMEPQLLTRVRRTPSQGEMVSARARRRNVRGAFRVAPERAQLAKGQNVLLVDDVLTTGATVDACAKALKRAGAAKVFVLALARVVRPAESAI